MQKAKPDHASSEQDRDFPLLDNRHWDHDPVRRCRYLCNSPSSLEHSLDTKSRNRDGSGAHVPRSFGVGVYTMRTSRPSTRLQTGRASSQLVSRQGGGRPARSAALNVTTTACRGRWPGFQPPLSFAGHVHSEESYRSEGSTVGYQSPAGFGAKQPACDSATARTILVHSEVKSAPRASPLASRPPLALRGSRRSGMTAVASNAHRIRHFVRRMCKSATNFRLT